MTQIHDHDDDVFPTATSPAGSMLDDAVDSLGSIFGVDDASERLHDWIRDAASSGPTIFDNHGGPIAGVFRHDPWWQLPPRGDEQEGKRIGRSAPVDIGERIGVCVHQTAARFGTSARRRAVWQRRIEDGELAEVDLTDHGIDDLAGCAERLALHERFWRAAYHWVGLANGDILHNNPATRYTYHGNGSNRQYLGVAAEGVLPGRESDRRSGDDLGTELFVETNRAVLRAAVDDARSLGAPIEFVTAHRCWSASRRGDPGELYWCEVVLPVAAEIDLRVDYDLAVKGGRPIPSDWDPDATHDWNGRTL